jgi:hypothetical protein
MIVLPRRSVTRFFIPMIDVLTLMFCIFLLLPVIQETANSGEGPTTAPEKSVPDMTSDTTDAELARRLHQENKELEELRRERVEVLQGRLNVRALNIDPNTGNLLGPQGQVIATQADALAMIDRDQRQARGKELYYLIIYPGQKIGYPEEKQVLAYDAWFRGVAHGFDKSRWGTKEPRP